MLDTTKTQALYAALRDDPCDWMRWMVCADAVQEKEGAEAAQVYRYCGSLIRSVMQGNQYTLRRIFDTDHIDCEFFRTAFHERRLNDLPGPIWIAIQQLVASRDEETFAYRHICGGDRYHHEGCPLTPEMIRLAATVGREPGATVGQQVHAGDTEQGDLYWLAVRRTDGRVRVATVGSHSIRGSELAWADAWKEGE